MIWNEEDDRVLPFDGGLAQFVANAKGNSVYTTMRTLNGKLLEAAGHANRLGVSLERLLFGLKRLLPSYDCAFVGLISQGQLSIWRYELSQPVNPCAVQLVEHPGRHDPAIKSTGWVQLRAEMQAAKPADCQEVIMVWQDELLEGLMSNVVVFTETEVQTAPYHRVLEGTTLRRLKEVCPVLEKSPRWSERFTWKAVLVMNQPWLILKVKCIYFGDEVFQLPTVPSRVEEIVSNTMRLLEDYATVV